MKRVFSLFIALSIMMINFNITISAEESVVTRLRNRENTHGILQVQAKVKMFTMYLMNMPI